MFTEVSAAPRRGSALSRLCKGDARCWLQREEVKPRQAAEPREVWGDLAWVQLSCLAGSKSLKDGLAGRGGCFQ